jgi:hypothetical protein
MKPPPADPLAFRDRVFDALCNDLAEGKGVARTEALRHISKQHRANACGTGLGRAKAPEPVKPSRPCGCHPISQGENK